MLSAPKWGTGEMSTQGKECGGGGGGGGAPEREQVSKAILFIEYLLASQVHR